MSVALTQWYRNISPQLSGCPNPVIKTYLIDVLRDFCEQTQLWGNNQLDAIDIVADTPEYALSSASGDIVAIDHAEVDGQPIHPESIKSLNELHIDWRQITTRRPRNYSFDDSSDNIRLIYTPSEDLTDGLVVWVSLKPLLTATTVENFLYNKYESVITRGVVGKLMQVSGRPWSDMNVGVAKERQYEAARDNAKVLKFTGRTHYQTTAPSEDFAL
jgi:hypothetical protein